LACFAVKNNRKGNTKPACRQSGFSQSIIDRDLFEEDITLDIKKLPAVKIICAIGQRVHRKV